MGVRVKLINNYPFYSLQVFLLITIEVRSIDQSSMDLHLNRRHLSHHCCSQISEVSGHSTDLNKKRKLLCEGTDSESPVSKQKLEKQQVTELAELSENSVNSPLIINNLHNATDLCMESHWYCTTSSSCSNEVTSCSTFGSSIEYGSGASTADVGPGDTLYGCKKELFKEIEALHDPVITELAKSSLGIYEDPDADTSDSMLYSNGLDEFETGSSLDEPIQHGRVVSRPLTIDQEFQHYFSKLML